MSKIVRAVALAAGIGALVPAQATLVNIDFNGIISTSTGNMSMPNSYGNAFDVVFGGAVNASKITSDGIGPANPVYGPHLERAVTSSSFTISIDPNSNPVNYSGFNSVELDFFHTTLLDISASDSQGQQLASLHAPCNSGSCGWDNDQVLKFSSAGVATRLTFTTTGSLLIDNLRLDMLPVGGSVPEPAGIGLVALALGGAGLASRRRKS